MMKSEKEVRERIAEIKSKLYDEDGEMMDEAYLDEGEQAELFTLSWVVGDEDY